MYYAVDRFEESFAVLQDDEEKNINIKRSLLPAETKQGDVFIEEDGRYLPAPEETARRRETVLKLQEKLLKRNSDGN